MATDEDVRSATVSAERVKRDPMWRTGWAHRTFALALGVPFFIFLFFFFLPLLYTLRGAESPLALPNPLSFMSEHSALPYRTKIRFHEGSPLVFPDFTLEYTGATKIRLPYGLVDFHEFRVTDNGNTTPLKKGMTGDIVPTPIILSNGKRFALELFVSSLFPSGEGKLESDELIVTPWESWERVSEKHIES